MWNIDSNDGKWFTSRLADFRRQHPLRVAVEESKRNIRSKNSNHNTSMRVGAGGPAAGRASVS
jgi:hypothetical protein